VYTTSLNNNSSSSSSSSITTERQVHVSRDFVREKARMTVAYPDGSDPATTPAACSHGHDDKLGGMISSSSSGGGGDGGCTISGSSSSVGSESLVREKLSSQLSPSRSSVADSSCTSKATTTRLSLCMLLLWSASHFVVVYAKYHPVRYCVTINTRVVFVGYGGL
jgi:hypothetical protein